MTRINYILIAILLSASSCADALPRREPVPEIMNYAKHDEEQAQIAKEYSERARVELERSEMLLKEVQALLRRAEAAEARCVEIAKKIPKKRKRRVYRSRGKRPPKPKTNPNVVLDASGVPKYSKSDAPPTVEKKDPAKENSSKKEGEKK